MDFGTIDVTPTDCATRCDICSKPFIYGWPIQAPDDPSGTRHIIQRNPDSGRQQEDGRWTHDSCYEAESQ